MRRGFSLVELIVALSIFQIGLLSTAGLVLLAQRHMVRAKVTLRALVEADRVADSLAQLGEGGSGSLPRPWGEIAWEADSGGDGGVRVVALSAGRGDTLAVLLAWPPLLDSLAGPSDPWVGEGHLE